MLEIDLLELYRSYSDSLMAFSEFHLTLIFGYLIAVHYISAQLTKGQFATMNFIYTVMILGMIVSEYRTAVSMASVAINIQEVGNTIPIFFPPNLAVATVIVWGAMYIGSIYFAFTARKRH